MCLSDMISCDHERGVMWTVEGFDRNRDGEEGRDDDGEEGRRKGREIDCI